MDKFSDSVKVENLQVVLQKIYNQHHDNAMLIALLQFLANEIKALHDHNNILGIVNNKNLLLHYNNLQNFKYISLADKNFSVLQQPLTLQQRAKDIAQLNFPDDYWRIFKHMYYGNSVIPEEFNQTADQERLQLRKQDPNLGQNEQNIWLWDEKSAQAMVVLNNKSKQRYRNLKQYAPTIWRVLKILPTLYFTYKRIIKLAYKKKICLTNCVGIALTTSYKATELDLLQELGNIPALLRFYCHEDMSKWDETIEFLRLLRARNVKVAVALVQDREAVINLEKWRIFLEKILPNIADQILWAEIGHATNRVKWGIWQTEEYLNLLELAFTAIEKYPHLRLIGPAVIDFEWYRIIDILQALPKKLKLFAISQHLYVDRRGAPENYQGKFSTLEKCALGQAIAQIFNSNEPNFIISEVNWPLQDTGIWSPIGSPYTAPEWFRDRPGVSEEEYANYLIRYLAIALCSGFVAQVFIWRLSAHGYGLVDDRNNFRKRPAFFALKNFLHLLNQFEFIERLSSDKVNYLLKFKNVNSTIILAWTTLDTEVEIKLPKKPTKIIDLSGNSYKMDGPTVKLTQSPCYYCFL